MFANLRNLKERLDKAYFICDLSKKDQNTIWCAVKLLAALNDVPAPKKDFLNEHAWVARDVLRELEDQFEYMTPRQEED